MSGRERIEQAAKENGWVMRPISVQTKNIDLVNFINDDDGILMTASFFKNGNFCYADGPGLNVAAITEGTDSASRQVIAYLQQHGARS